MSKFDLEMFDKLKKGDKIKLTKDFNTWGNFIPKGTILIVRDFSQNGIDLHTEAQIIYTPYVINLFYAEFTILRGFWALFDIEDLLGDYNDE